MIYPRIHRSGPAIRAEYDEVVRALSDTIAAFAKINFAGRDYYSHAMVPASLTAQSIAHNEHMSRLNRLVSVRAELEEILADIDEQVQDDKR